jgi:hypothetical protein
MSNMLKEAIVDAKALRESALKNAENVVIKKYSDEVRKTIEHILEQDELGLEPAIEEPAMDAPEVPSGDPMNMEETVEVEEVVENEDDLPYAATNDLSDADGKNLDSFPSSNEELEVSIDLGALQEALKELQENEEVEVDLSDISETTKTVDEEIIEEDDEVEGEEGESPVEAASSQDKASGYGGTNESAGIDIDSLVDAITEKLKVDTASEISGWAGRPTSQLKQEQERELAGEQSDDVKEELEDLNKAQKELAEENSQLKEQIEKYKQVTQELKEGLQDVNFSNARLLYTNRVLRNTSLNERQKTKIVEAISGAGSVAEARTIFDTLQSTVESTPKRGPQSLSEAITRNRTSVIRASRNETTASDPFQDRMKKLAGIK